MLKPVAMVHLRAQVGARDASAATRCLAREGLLHLVDLAHGRAATAAPGGTLELLATFRDLERRAREAARRAGVGLAEPRGALPADEIPGYPEEAQAIEAALRPLEEALTAPRAALAAARERRSRAKEAVVRAERLAAAGIDPARLAGLRFLDLRIGRAREEDLSQLDELIGPTPHSLLPLARDGEAWIFAAAAPASSRERLDAALATVACETIRAAASDGTTAPAAELAAAEAEVAAREAELAAAGRAATPALQDLAARAQLCVILLQAQTCFAEVGRFVVISGWVPAREAARLADSIRAATHNCAVVDLSEPDELAEVAAGRLKVPILHRNPLLLRPFQQLIGLYGTPAYREVEPTPFFALSFLLMFGLMFGDVGHGAVLFSAGWLLFRHFPRFLDYGILLMEGGVSSVTFGLVYGSLFGREDILPALWLRPMHDLTRFMAVAVAMGIVFITIGMVLNVINTWRSGERAGALAGLGGVAGAFLYWVGVALAARALLPHPWRLPAWVPMALLAVPVALLVLQPVLARRLDRKRPEHPHGPTWLRALEGLVDLVDALFGFFANTFSFARVAAFAAVHAGVLIALNAIADTVAGVRFGGAWSLLVLLAGNAVVILLEGLTVSVQVLRLEYYEFFTRFFRGDGEPYRPFSLGGAAEKGTVDARSDQGRPGGGGVPRPGARGGGGDLGVRPGDPNRGTGARPA